MTARLAGIEDIPPLIELLREFAEASQYGIGYDEESIEETIISLLDHVLVVYGDPPVGVAGAVIGPVFYNKHEKQAVELFWWVKPECRGVGRFLIEKLESESKRKGAKRIAMLCLESLSPEKVGEMYVKNGYVLKEHGYMKEL